MKIRYISTTWLPKPEFDSLVFHERFKSLTGFCYEIRNIQIKREGDDTAGLVLTPRLSG